jgi:hypothetical protein
VCVREGEVSTRFTGSAPAKFRATHRILSGTTTTSCSEPSVNCGNTTAGRVGVHGSSVNPDTNTTSGAIDEGTTRGAAATTDRPPSVFTNGANCAENTAVKSVGVAVHLPPITQHPPTSEEGARLMFMQSPACGRQYSTVLPQFGKLFE